ncbi:flagellar biosynthetic protein FliO [Kiloniella laminariae]|uniref:Flagellar biosynthetic protein FliO n=1 Tax=Kiloniella laminariae TaxID=454162 RepID=A0ABT4LHA5_9PROT|nr:flagellar biosynthetic protein FliO [Kiloniella laminariae]MCZ4280481.1 flagellar biosynthetic protein FliO [Kiloniella laminariae]
MEYGNYVQFLLSLVFVLGLILAIALLARRFGLGNSPIQKGGKHKRIHLVEVRPLDARRRLVIVRCDDREHLLLTGGTHDLVIDSNLPSPPDSDNSLQGGDNQKTDQEKSGRQQINDR